MQQTGPGPKHTKPRITTDRNMISDPNCPPAESQEELAEFNQYLLEKSNHAATVNNPKSTTSNNNPNTSLSDPKRKSIMTMNLNYLKDKMTVLTNIKKLHLSHFKEIHNTNA